MLSAHPVGYADIVAFLDTVKFIDRVGLFAAEQNYHTAVIIPRPPHKITLVRADRFGQAVGAAEMVDRCGLTVVGAEDRGPRTFIGRKRIVNAGDFSDHLGPAEHVAEMLRQRPAKPDLGL